MKESNITWHDAQTTRQQINQLLGHKSAVLWLTGLSGAGKSTIAMALQKKLLDENRLAYVLDGDNVRHGLNKDLGFSAEDRKENIRRVGEVAKLFADAGIITMVSLISPYAEDRNIARNLIQENFIETHITCPMEICEKRDPKGLYKKARQGEIKNFTGVSAPYEMPENPELTLDTSILNINESVEKIHEFLKSKGYLG